MPKKKNLGEKRYYGVVQEYLRTKMGCVVESFDKDGKRRPFICRGLNRLVIDVYGLRGVKERHSRQLEGVAVEVKGSRSRTPLRHLVQTRQYAQLAHRCYLAQPASFSQKTIADASKFGVGLLRIVGKRVQLIAESRPFTPDPVTFSLFLHRSLRLVRCTICDCYRLRHTEAAGLSRGDSGVNGHWVADHLSPARRRGALNKMMFICERCEVLLNIILGAERLRKSVRSLEKRVKTLQRKVKRF